MTETIVEKSCASRRKLEYDEGSTPSVLRLYLEEYRRLESQIKELEQEKGRFRADIQEMVDEEEAESVKTPYGSAGWTAGRVSKKLDERKLLEKGVAATVIQECTEMTEGKPSFRVTLPREKRD